MKALNTFIGCGVKNNMITCDGVHLFFAGANSIARVEETSIADVVFVEDTINCIRMKNGRLVVGCTNGRVYLMLPNEPRRSAMLKPNIQVCVPLGEDYMIVCTLTEILLVDRDLQVLSEAALDCVISCVDSHGRMVYVGTGDGHLYVYSTSDEVLRQVARTFEVAHSDRVRALRISWNGCIATGGQDKTIKLWAFDGEALQCVQVLSGHSGWVNTLDWFGNRLYSASTDRTLRVWKQEPVDDADCKRCCADPCVCSFSDRYRVYCIGFIGGGSSEYLSIASMGESFYAHAVTGGIDLVTRTVDNCITFEYVASGFTDAVTAIDWCGDLLLCSSLDMTSRIFYKGVEAGRVQVHGWPIVACGFLPGSVIRVVSAGTETILRIYKATQAFMDTCKRVQDAVSDDSDSDDLAKFVSDESGAKLLDNSSSSDDDCFVWRRMGAQPQEDKDSENMEITAEDERGFKKLDLAVSAYLTELDLTPTVSKETPSDEHSDRTMSSNVFEETHKLYGHFYDISAVATNRHFIFSANKSSRLEEAGLFMWTHTGEKLHYYKAHSLGITKIIATENAVLTVGRDRKAFLYTIRNEGLIERGSVCDHKRALLDGGIAHDGLHFATCSLDGRLILYCMKTLEPLGLRSFDVLVTSLDFSPSENIIAVGLDDGTLFFIDYELEILYSSRVISKRITALKYNCSGRRLAIGGADGVVQVIDIPRRCNFTGE